MYRMCSSRALSVGANLAVPSTKETTEPNLVGQVKKAVSKRVRAWTPLAVAMFLYPTSLSIDPLLPNTVVCAAAAVDTAATADRVSHYVIPALRLVDGGSVNRKATWLRCSSVSPFDSWNHRRK